MSTPNFHIIGLGSMGSIVAFALQKRFPTYNIIPILRSEAKVKLFKDNYESKFTLHRQYSNKTDISESFNLTTDLNNVKEDHIDNLIITTKTFQTIDALKPIWNKIDETTNIILIQNGIGTYDSLVEKFPEIKTKNFKIFQGVIAHAVFGNSNNFTEFYHAGFLDLKVAQINGFEDESKKIQSIKEVNDLIENNELLTTLKEIDLDCKVMSYQELIIGQIKKFCVNCCMNGWTSILNCMNGDLNYVRESTLDLFEQTIDEVLKVFSKSPDYKEVFEYENKENMPLVDVSFKDDYKKLAEWVYQIGVIDCGGNSSSMRQDVINKRGTEINFINGYVVKLGKKMGLPKSEYKVNEIVVNLHKLKCEMIKNGGAV